MPSELDHPRSADDLYLARGLEVEPFRPFMQSDVFRCISIPGVDTDDTSERLAIVMTHPCSMRRGARLASLLHVARIHSERQTIPFDRWSSGHFRVMPLPCLFPDREDGSHAVRFEEPGRIPSARLSLDRRVACLSDEGIVLLQQRFVHYLTRVIVSKTELLAHVQHVLEEADLQEEWTRSRLEHLPRPQIADRLDDEIKRFDRFLGEERPGQRSLRESLKTPELRASVRRAVRARIRECTSGHGPAGSPGEEEPGSNG